MSYALMVNLRNWQTMLIYGLLFLLAGASAALAESVTINVELNKGSMVKLSRPASSVVIADPDTADVQVVSPKLLFVHGKQVGETSLYAVDEKDNDILTSVVRVTHNLSSLRKTVTRVVPDADVSFRTVDGGMVMEGFAASSDESQRIADVASTFLGANERMVNMVQTNGSDQVMLKVKLVEMSRTNLKRVGVNLQNVTSNGNFAWQVLQGNDILFNTPDPNIQAFSQFGNVLSRGANTDSNVLLRYRDTAALLEALETQGLAHVLAEPSLTTTSGQPASFLAGGQFPLPVFGQNNTVALQYQTFGVGLNFTPIVLAHDRISLSVSPEVSTLNFNNPIQVSGITYPILETRRASATVELGSGDSFVLAGLLRNENSNNVQKFPGLGDVPILGGLFRSNQFQNNQTELVMMVTPYIVRPVANKKRLQTPLDGYKPPSDMDRLMRGSLYKQQSMNNPSEDMDDDVTAVASKAPAAGHPNHHATPHLHGAGGFILD